MPVQAHDVVSVPVHLDFLRLRLDIVDVDGLLLAPESDLVVEGRAGYLLQILYFRVQRFLYECGGMHQSYMGVSEDRTGWI